MLSFPEKYYGVKRPYLVQVFSSKERLHSDTIGHRRDRPRLDVLPPEVPITSPGQ